VASIVNRVDHIGLAVRDLDVTGGFLRDVLGYAFERGQRDLVGQGVELLRSDEIEYELLEHLHPMVVGRFQEDGDDCQFHHLCVEVDDLEATMERLRAKGVQFTTPRASVSEIPNRGRRSTVFTVPETSGDLMFQFVQYL
jgi:catechol 2,3-dioxygenase-like lactoylglutathione lyase family enzyme